jgi:hypothetical protein
LTRDDALYRFRVRVFALAEEMGSVRAACRAMGIHPSTFYRWHRQVHRFGFDILHPRERRRPRMPNATSPLMEQKVLTFALAHPTVGPQRISDELRRPKWGGIRISPNGVHKVLRRHGLNTKAKRLGLVGHGDVLAIHRRRHRLRVHVGRAPPHPEKPLGALHELARPPGPRRPRPAGWRLEAVSTDNASEFRSAQFEEALEAAGARHVFIRAGRPQSNGYVERAHKTVLDECWKPAFARYLIPKYTGLRLDLDRFVRSTTPTVHTEEDTLRGRIPAQIIGAR